MTDSRSSTGTAEAFEDFRTHRASWRRALELSLAMAAPAGVDSDDTAYWLHELAAFDRTFDALCCAAAQEAVTRGVLLQARPAEGGAWSLHEIQSAADAVVSRVNEWDDRTSPEDFPEALLITSSELHRELMRFAEDIGALAIPSTHQPAPERLTPQNTAERLPSSDAAISGAGTGGGK